MIRTILLSSLLSFFACKTERKQIVFTAEVSRYIRATEKKLSLASINAELIFWGDRMAKNPGGIVNEEKYAVALESRFHLTGGINDLLLADSIFEVLKVRTRSGEAGILRNLARLAISRHEFARADSLVQQAINVGSEKYTSTLMQFDVAFELGHYKWSEQILKRLFSTNEYGYFFRKARWFHYKAKHDSSIIAMQKALELADGNKALQIASLSNLGDLYLHNNDPVNAYRQYLNCLQLQPDDNHSLMGIGSIALLHDKNDSIAEEMFKFCSQQTLSPDPLLKMIWLAEFRHKNEAIQKYAQQFVSRASMPVYGNMYNKYLIDIYSSSAPNYAGAISIAEKEVTVRPNAQTFAWYAWALHKNREQEKAKEIFEKNVSGKPLEALELYYMGLMLHDSQRKNLAMQYLEAAQKNKYDLGPAKLERIDSLLNH